jgi:hypothetical protein
MPLESYPDQLEPENHDAVIWRFIKLARFRDLMATGELYFCRADLFPNDVREGLPPEDYLQCSGFLSILWRQPPIAKFIRPSGSPRSGHPPLAATVSSFTGGGSKWACRGPSLYPIIQRGVSGTSSVHVPFLNIRVSRDQGWPAGTRQKASSGFLLWRLNCTKTCQTATHVGAGGLKQQLRIRLSCWNRRN